MPTPTMSDDVFVSEEGNQTIDGLGGWDTMYFTGGGSGYRIEDDGKGTVTVTDLNPVSGGDDGVDTLTNIEELQFDDGVQAYFGTTISKAVVPVAPADLDSGVEVDEVSLTVLNNGGWLLTWEEEHFEEVDFGGYYYGPSEFEVVTVKQQQFAANGSAVGAVKTLAEFETPTGYYSYSNDEVSTDTAILADGGWVVAIRQGNDIVIQRYAADGTFIFDEEIEWLADNYGEGVNVTALDDGGFLVTANNETNWVGGYYDYYYTYVPEREVQSSEEVKFDADGVIDYAYGYGYSDGGTDTSDIAAGGAVAIEIDQATGASYIVNVYDTDTGEFTQSYTGNSYGYMLSEPEIVTLADGGSVAVWVAQGSDNYIMMQQFDTAGLPIDLPQTIAGGYSYYSGPSDPESPDVVALADGGWAVVWSDNGSLYQERYTAEGVSADGQPILITDESEEFSITALAGGQWVVAWTDEDGVLNQQQFSVGTTIWGTNGYNGYGDDHIVAGAGDQLISGYASSYSYFDGNDTLEGGAGDDVLKGGNGDNLLLGGAGNDVLISRGWMDTLDGGDGDDVYLIDLQAGDTLGAFISSDTSGNDTLQIADQGGDAIASVIDLNVNSSSVVTFDNGESRSFTIGVNAKIENVIATEGDDYVIGNSLNNLIVTGEGADTIESGAGNDRVIAGEGDDYIIDTAGNDALSGGVGSDTYVVGGSAGSVTINDDGSWWSGDVNTIDVSGATSATVVDLTGGVGKAGGTRTLTINGEISHVIGSAFADLITGNDLANKLQGFAGNDTLVGAGDEARDTLIGGLGDDKYIVDGDSPDMVLEAVAAGTDTVEFHATDDYQSYVLGSNVEKLVLVGSYVDWLSGETVSIDVNGYGNSLNNTITGNNGDNELDGGKGNDTLIGGKGDDTYVVDSLLDVIQETSTDLEEWDEVDASVNWILGANLEELNLYGTAINGTGNALSNEINGNALANKLDGGAGNDSLWGGKGNDTLIGGTGNDLYDNVEANDVVTETSALVTEIDTVLASYGINYTLGANLENLELQGGNLNATGNALANTLVGTTGNNVFDGLGGLDTVRYSSLTPWNSGYSGGIADSGVTVDLDIVGAQNTFGSGMDTLVNIENLTGSEFNDVLKGTAAANVLDGGDGSDELTGRAGDDTYVVDSYGDTVIEAVGEGSDTVRSTLYDTTLAANVEKLVLVDGAVQGFGNSLNNTITGTDFNNYLDGNTGSDTLIGGKGNDWYVVDVATDVVTETSVLITEIDTVESSVSYTLGVNVENLVLSGVADINATGNALANVLYSNAGANVLNGGTGIDTASYAYALGSVTVSLALATAQATGAGSDTLLGIENLEGSGSNDTLTGNAAANVLDGGWGEDTLIGGAGNDTYIVDDYDDVIIEASALAAEIDTVKSKADYYALGSNVENLIILEEAGEADADGNTLNNKLTGNDYDNELWGGAGNDTLIGGKGNDSYYVDAVGDVIQETSIEPYEWDRVFSEVNWTLGANLEALYLADGNINGTGNALNNELYGGDGNNILNGLAGGDYMEGGAGNDTYIVDNLDDDVYENNGNGTDTVQSSVSFDIGNAGEVENLTLTGTANINGTGNWLNNNIVGNTGANTLYGGVGDDTLNGGTGVDTMIGGAGNDTYVVDNTADKVIEVNADPLQVDTVQSSVSFTLSAFVENLILTGAGAINGTGNDLDNTLLGNAASNTLNGGAGADILTGGAGADKFVIDNLLGVDTVTDFVKASDKLVLDMSGLGGIGDGDALIETALVKVAGSGGFSGAPNSANELVIFQQDIAGVIDASSAAAAIGSATSAMAIDATKLFVVDNGAESHVFLFTSANGDAVVDAAELQLLATLNVTNTAATDYLFQV